MIQTEAGPVFSARCDVVSSELSDGAALLDLRAGKYYSLNAVGACVWNAIRAPVAEQDLILSVCENFDVDASVCQADIRALLAALVQAGLVEVGNVEAPV